MEVIRIGISATQRGKLLSAGYTSLSSLSSVSPPILARALIPLPALAFVLSRLIDSNSELSHATIIQELVFLDLNISVSEAAEILKAASHSTRLGNSSGNHMILNGAQTAWEMLSEDSLTRITTSCSDIDNIFGGGICCREVTEIGGVPGIGKTQFRIQLAVNVQIPVDCGGLGGKAVYLDTEGSFMVERALQMAKGYIEDINYTEQVAVINHLEKFVSEHRDVKVVVIDSVTFYFRQDFEDMALRTRILGGMALKLMKLAQKFNLAVVLLNQAATKCSEGSYQLTLALGDSWSHASTNRIILYWNGDERYAHLDKSPSLPSASAPYSITTKGIQNSSTSYKRTKLM